ncbi:glycine N-methyltransferase-like [Asterias amurensis]|uniref:glycine N-methyltransferase-like n=1 Tax=Asterias amurensis TaxID=7602 RepID=UPI003AB401EF
MVDSIYRTRSLGVAAQGIPDQYADGKAAKVWEYYIGSRTERTENYRHFLVDLLQSRKCHEVLDAACGTGIDSVMLLEQGFHVMSCDASDKMILHAFRERWARRKEEMFDSWEIEIANWLTLPEDIPKPGPGYDAIVCLGNSFAHLPDFDGKQENHRLALRNFASMLKPGGILIIDHRNYDAIIDTGRAPVQNIYYVGNCIKDLQTSVLYVNGRPSMVTLDYFISVDDEAKNEENVKKMHLDENVYKFRLSYYPHRLNAFTELLKETFGESCKHTVYGDFKEFKEGDCPSYYIHVIEKPLE